MADPSTLYRNLNKEQTEELYQFKSQNRLDLEREECRHAFGEKQRLQRLAFEDEESDKRLDIVYSFGHKIWKLTSRSRGIDELRKTTSPAYSFLKFRELPVEIQLRIWSLAARGDKPQTHVIASMSDDDPEGLFHDSRAYCLKGSSRIEPVGNGWPSQRRPVPSVLHVCQQSRGECLKIYTRLAAKYGDGSWPGRELYFNTLYDSFYMGYNSWDDFKILVDILIKFNTTRPLRTKVRTGMEQLRNLRNIVVDLNIFGAVPAAIWTKFPKLEKLTVAFYPYRGIKDPEPNGDIDGEFTFTKPRRGRYEKRASWIVTTVTSALEAVTKNTTPEWKLPTIEAVLRSDVMEDGDHFDSDSEEQDEASEDGSNGDDDENVEDYDSTWYRQAAARMTHEVPKQEFKRLKQRHHPSRKVGHGGSYPGKNWGEWLTDSETEGAKDDYDRKCIYTDDEWRRRRFSFLTVERFWGL